MNEQDVLSVGEPDTAGGAQLRRVDSRAVGTPECAQRSDESLNRMPAAR